MTARSLFLLATAATLSGACARHAEAASAPVVAPDTATHAVATTTPDSSRVTREYRGAYSSGYEVSWFEPCDAPAGDGRWWVTLTDDARAQRDSLVKLLPVRPTQGLAVQWRGTVSPRMRGGAGHMGRGSRYMLVTEVLSVRPLDGNGQGACRSVERG